MSSSMHRPRPRSALLASKVGVLPALDGDVSPEEVTAEEGADPVQTCADPMQIEGDVTGHADDPVHP
jgi:hypothetical protein